MPVSKYYRGIEFGAQPEMPRDISLSFSRRAIAMIFALAARRQRQLHAARQTRIFDIAIYDDGDMR